MKQYKIAGYCRISVDEELEKENTSIENQKEIIAKYVTECDFAGVVSANNDAEKFQKTKFHAEKSSFVNAPVISELPMTLECRLISYDNSAGCAVGEIVNISADERILDENGKISVEKLRPICFDPVHHVYREMGAEVGKAFHDGLELK